MGKRSDRRRVDRPQPPPEGGGAGRTGGGRRGRNREGHPSEPDDNPVTEPPRGGHAPNTTHTGASPGTTAPADAAGAQGQTEPQRAPHKRTAKRGTTTGKRGTPRPLRAESEDREQAGERPHRRGPAGDRTAANPRREAEEEDRPTVNTGPRHRARDGGGREEADQRLLPREGGKRGAEPAEGGRAWGRGKRHRPEPPPPHRGHARGFVSPPRRPPWHPGSPPTHAFPEGGGAGRAPQTHLGRQNPPTGGGNNR